MKISLVRETNIKGPVQKKIQQPLSHQIASNIRVFILLFFSRRVRAVHIESILAQPAKFVFSNIKFCRKFEMGLKIYNFLHKRSQKT